MGIVSQLLENAHQLLAHLGISQVHILGSSAGGPIAMKFALEHPEMTQSLLLVNTMSYYQEKPNVKLGKQNWNAFCQQSRIRRIPL
ncbi:MAG: hypothetical protein CM1200mP35_03890 [Chloroflexota bacterium]|nr:MAG: hypothetical protein CM1200mP35_03890 [Chloroflexota bacterium]